MTILVTGGAEFIGSNLLCQNMIEYIQDRPVHDRRYSTDITKISSELKWSSRFFLTEGLNITIEWYSNL